MLRLVQRTNRCNVTTFQLAVDPTRGDPHRSGMVVVRSASGEQLALINGRLYRWDRIRFCLVPADVN